MAEITASSAKEVLTDTAIHMLDTAERLFAETSIDRVSLREIVRASGQANLSAAHYHFGSREALIGKLLARRIRAINVIRHQRLDALVASGGDKSAYGVAYASVMVLSDVVKTMPWGPDYVRVVAQALFNENPDIWSFMDPDTMSGHIRVREMLRTLLPELPPRVFKDRLWSLNNLATFGLARWVQSHGPVLPANSRRYAAMSRNLAGFLAAGMAAAHGGPVDDAPNENEER
ncbi:helix-turn-helix domain containing protein [Comamonadaceae bacterium G21597-S1]|nr:helix-turn-helix domain containing protein [Comamonadaceae bacterium G21597-S1]